MKKKEHQFLYLTTTGRKTGLPREIEIWFTELDGRYYLIAERCERTNWVQNIMKDPHIVFRVGDSIFKGMGRTVSEPNERSLSINVRALSEQKYGWSEGLIVELKPEIPSCLMF